MPINLKSDAASGVSVSDQSVYYSLASPLWTNLTKGDFAPYACHYSKPGEGWKDGELATMNLAKWGGGHDWYSALLRLSVALGFGSYEQSIKIGKGSGITTASYLSEYDQDHRDRKDREQEIDFEFSGQDTQHVQTTVWWHGQQNPVVLPLWKGAPPAKAPDATSGWGSDVYRYKIDWEPDAVTWSVDVTGSGNSYVEIRRQDMSTVGSYQESLCYLYMSFWTGWTFDNSKFLDGADAQGNCGTSGRCYQAFFFQSLKFTPSRRNQLVTLGG